MSVAQNPRYKLGMPPSFSRLVAQWTGPLYFAKDLDAPGWVWTCKRHLIRSTGATTNVMKHAEIEPAQKRWLAGGIPPGFTFFCPLSRYCVALATTCFPNPYAQKLKANKGVTITRGVPIPCECERIMEYSYDWCEDIRLQQSPTFVKSKDAFMNKSSPEAVISSSVS